MRKIIEFFKMYLVKPIREVVFLILHRISEFCNNQMDAMNPKGPGLVYEKPTKAEKKEYNAKIYIVIVIIMLLVCLVIIINRFANYYYTIRDNRLSFGEWNSSAGSFWGAVLGSIVAGITTLGTTWLIIQRSYKIDYHRERLEAMPVFNLEVALHNYILQSYDVTDIICRLNEQMPMDVFFGDSAPTDNVYVLKLQNVGQGIAYRVEATKMWSEEVEPFYEGLMPKDKYILMLLNYCGDQDDYSDMLCVITYDDLHENKYQQCFQLHVEEGKIKTIISKPPELVLKTQRIRYTQ